MYKHHEDTIRNITEKLRSNSDIQALIIGGSIAHGFATEKSDIDIMLVVSNDDYTKRLATGDLHYFETESCTYESGYIDGKFICTSFMNKVAKSGSEPARFAFKDAFVAFSRIDDIHSILNAITTYPIERKQENIIRFYSQLEAWKWYCNEAIKHKNKYLLNHSISNLTLFGGRMLLAHNETLYPYHKWFLKVLEGVPNKPCDILLNIENMLIKQDEESIDNYYRSIIYYTDWGVKEINWPNQFMLDSELCWLDAKMNIADI